MGQCTQEDIAGNKRGYNNGNLENIIIFNIIF
jgi:hypothetical protein